MPSFYGNWADLTIVVVPDQGVIVERIPLISGLRQTLRWAIDSRPAPMPRSTVNWLATFRPTQISMFYLEPPPEVRLPVVSCLALRA